MGVGADVSSVHMQKLRSYSACTQTKKLPICMTGICARGRDECHEDLRRCEQRDVGFDREGCAKGQPHSAQRGQHLRGM